MGILFYIGLTLFVVSISFIFYHIKYSVYDNKLSIAVSCICLFFGLVIIGGIAMECSTTKRDRNSHLQLYNKYSTIIDNNMVISYEEITEIKEYNDNIIRANENVENKWIGIYYKDYANLPLLDYEKAVLSYSYNLKNGITIDENIDKTE